MGAKVGSPENCVARRSLMHKAMIRFGISALLLLATFASAQAQAPPSGAQGVHSEMLVSTQWLAEHSKDTDVLVLHITDSQSDYKRCHIYAPRPRECPRSTGRSAKNGGRHGGRSARASPGCTAPRALRRRSSARGSCSLLGRHPGKQRESCVSVAGEIAVALRCARN